MKKIVILVSLIFVLLPNPAMAQQAVDNFVSDPSLTHASIGIYMTNIKTGETIAAYDEQKAITPASTIKLITSATALQLLGGAYRTYTTVGYSGTIDEKGILHGDLIIRGGGDPSLGSAFGSRDPNDFIDQVAWSIRSSHIKAIDGNIIVDNSLFNDYFPTSPKWMMEDVIWYYGTGCHAFSYRDNRLDIEVKYNGREYEITNIKPANLFQIETDLSKGEEENIVVQNTGNRYTLSGTIPQQKNRYRLSLAVARPDSLFIHELSDRLQRLGITVNHRGYETSANRETTLFRYPSDSLAYLVRSLNKRSDNLYAESVLRLLSISSGTKGNCREGIGQIRRYWQSCGADSLGLFMYDGSGLARNNKVSAKYLARVLEIAAQEPQTGDIFVNSLPLVGKEGSVATFMRNNKLPGELRLKSGSMSDIHAYAGYYTTPQNRYAIVIMVNNYNSSRAQLKQKMATLLNTLLSKKE